ncbi:YdeI/OmpD-associated family protein [Aquimarina sp. SS2-1]|uniref:YdeI/OmpD-associated family protein n=1 Tax=Aquimarina besae TaxID=3342247 RepID=UPI00366FCC48
MKVRFGKLTPFKQKEYKEYIATAKREATRISRVEKIIPMILKGIGLNDTYR